MNTMNRWPMLFAQLSSPPNGIWSNINLVLSVWVILAQLTIQTIPVNGQYYQLASRLAQQQPTPLLFDPDYPSSLNHHHPPSSSLLFPPSSLSSPSLSSSSENEQVGHSTTNDKTNKTPARTLAQLAAGQKEAEQIMNPNEVLIGGAGIGQFRPIDYDELMLIEPFETEMKRAEWGKFNGAWGKRLANWNKLQSAWGKRRAPGSGIMARSWNNLNGAWGRKRAKWNELNGMWGKRSPTWNKLSSAWGKRKRSAPPPHWNKLRGMWGKKRADKQENLDEHIDKIQNNSTLIMDNNKINNNTTTNKPEIIQINNLSHN